MAKKAKSMVVVGLDVKVKAFFNDDGTLSEARYNAGPNKGKPYQWDAAEKRSWEAQWQAKNNG